MKRRRSKQRAPHTVIIFGIIFSFAILKILSFISSFILANTQNPILSIKITSLVIILLTAAISGFAIAKYKGDLNFGISIFTSLAVTVIMLAISLISAKGNVGGATVMNYVCYALVSLFFSFIGNRKAKTHHRRNR